MKELQVDDTWTKREIKDQPLTAQEIDYMHDLAGSYEALFSRRSRQYQKLGLKDQALTEHDYRHYLLEHYSFLKRPVEILDDAIFIGSAKQQVSAAQKKLGI